MLLKSVNHTTVSNLLNNERVSGCDILESRTSDPGRKGASRNVLVVVFDQDAVVSRQDRQVGHRARPVLVVHAANVSLGRTLNGQGQTTCREVESNLSFRLFSTLAV